MSHINLLDSATINKIAAGEVVERPVSVVKELTENALDAGATTVTVEIRDGGTSLIRVTDNGAGIAPDEVRKAFLRHSTSKIATVEDLLSARTLGFRGEALASIAAVARVEVFTKEKEQLTGVHYVIEGGSEQVYEEAACPDGTTVRVENLFYNVPARLKFLKKPGLEAASVTDYMQRLILGHPNVAIRYYNGRPEPALIAPGRGDLKNCLFAVYGRDITDKVIPVSREEGLFAIRGYISRPQLTRPNRAFQSLFINGRWVRSAVVDRILDDVYKDLIVPGTFPVSVLHLHMDPSLLDVNVHPTKMQVRFICEAELRAFLYAALDEALAAPSLISREGRIYEKPAEKEAGTTAPAEKPAETEADKPAAPGQSASPAEETKPAESVKTESPVLRGEQITVYEEEAPKDIAPAVSEDEKPFGDEKPLPQNLRIIGQAFETYWLAEGDGLLYMMDQHAAHERVLYDRFRAMLRSGEVGSQLLLEPVVASVSPRDVAELPLHEAELSRLGFTVEAFGEDAVIVRAVPYIFNGPMDPEDMHTLLDILSGGAREASRDLLIDKMAMTSCKAAVKGSSLMTEAEAAHLLEDLLASENPYNCPHGRPTIISVSRYDIERRFKRA